MFGYIPPTSGVSEKKKVIPSPRDRELENDIGNLAITEYQAHRLRERLAGRIISTNKSSEYIYKNDSGNWIRVYMVAEKFEIPGPPEEEPVKDPNPNNENVQIVPQPLFLANVSGSEGARGLVRAVTEGINTYGLLPRNSVYSSGIPVERDPYTGQIRISGSIAGIPREDLYVEYDSEDVPIA